MDENGTFLDYKAGDNKHFFLPQEKIIGTSVDSILPPEIGAMTMSAIKTSLHTSTPQIFEYKLQTQGGLFTYEARIVASSPHEVITIIHDITERTRLEQMKTDFINRASHELRTPITTAILMVDLLDRTDLDPNERGDYWKILKQELNRERIILEDVLTVGRIESGRYRIAGGSVSILPVLNNAINAMQAQADLRKIAIHVEISEQIPNLRGAEEAFARVFNNIISNAVKFSNPEGTVKVHACQKGNEVIIDVADHGIGIPPEDLPHITSRFFRGTNASNLEIPGSGIGLYIIKNIVEELGGKLNIHSILGQGTTISVCFPISRE
jgi:two-component system phosphate regulon sensor histidine kinase PhoR